MNDEKPNFEPPRSLKGRKARQIWRQLAPRCDANGLFHAGTRVLLAAYAATCAEIDEDPAGAHGTDLDRARALGKALGLSR
jgi:hypothetical protein